MRDSTLLEKTYVYIGCGGAYHTSANNNSTRPSPSIQLSTKPTRASEQQKQHHHQNLFFFFLNTLAKIFTCYLTILGLTIYHFIYKCMDQGRRESTSAATTMTGSSRRDSTTSYDVNYLEVLLSTYPDSAPEWGAFRSWSLRSPFLVSASAPTSHLSPQHDSIRQSSYVCYSQPPT